MLLMTSKGFNKRRDHEAKQELNLDSKQHPRIAQPERPLRNQSAPHPKNNRSLISRLWRALAGS